LRISWEAYEYIKSRLPEDLTPKQYEQICRVISDYMELEPCEGKSQVERVYNHLQLHGSITNAEAHSIYGIRHLPSVIADIKERYNAHFREEKKTGCNRFGEASWWQLYILIPEEKDEETQKGYGQGSTEIQNIRPEERGTQIGIPTLAELLQPLNGGITSLHTI